MNLSGIRIVGIVPCYNEEVAVGRVVSDLHAAVPEMDIYVYDNNSTDNTARVATEAGAIVRHEEHRGKGNVVRRAFADIDADVYLLIDGDNTYDAAAAPMMIQTLLQGNYDHVLGCRVPEADVEAYRPGHERGNRLFNVMVSLLFGSQVSDMLSGYRVFSRRFVKSFPALSREFEIETELTVHSMELRLPQTEVEVGFRDRPEGSFSKLSTFRDGTRIMTLILRLFALQKPGLVYGALSLLALILGIALGVPVIWEFFETGLVPRLPTAVLASSLVIMSLLSAVVGVILTGVLRGRQEAMRLAYLRYRSVGTTHGGGSDD